VNIHCFIPSDDLVNRSARGKPEHHVANAWRPVISSELMENEVKEAVQDIAEVWHVTPLMAPRASSARALPMTVSADPFACKSISREHGRESPGRQRMPPAAICDSSASDRHAMPRGRQVNTLVTPGICRPSDSYRPRTLSSRPCSTRPCLPFCETPQTQIFTLSRLWYSLALLWSRRIWQQRNRRSVAAWENAGKLNDLDHFHSRHTNW
jgi:hypothetical protein